MLFSQKRCSQHYVSSLREQPIGKFYTFNCKMPDLYILLAFVIVLFSLFSQTKNAYAAINIPLDYNCGPATPTVNNPHCYYVARWNGAPGSFTEIYTNEIYGGSDVTQGDFVTNEMWLGDSSNSWVEAGLQSENYTNFNSEFLFWADQRPGSAFFSHPGPFLQGNEFGKYASFEIIKTAKDTYNVAAYGLPESSQNGTSIQNSMALNDITIGGEVDGSAGASSPKNGYIQNEWYNPNGVGSWQYQGNPGFFIGPSGGSPNPWHGGWVDSPNGSNNNGGHFQTCLPSGC